MVSKRISLRIGLLAILILLQVTACGGEKVKGGQITIRNDILDKKYNTFQVDRVITANGSSGFRRLLKPGDEVELPFKWIRSIRFTRRYSDHSKVYVVSCPKGFGEKVQFKLIDVHTNRLGGGCELRKRGRKERGIVDWE